MKEMETSDRRDAVVMNRFLTVTAL